MRRDSFQAIADPTRRKILYMLSDQALSVNAVVGNFKVSRTAIYKHIKVLRECGLVSIKKQGRERYCEAKMKSLKEICDWVGQFRQHWTVKMDTPAIYPGSVHTKKRNQNTRID